MSLTSENNTKQLRVLHLLKTSEGASWALKLMRELVKFGLDIHVALPKGGRLIPLYESYGITIHEYNCSLKSLVQSIRSLRKIVDDVRPDIIHSHFVLTTLIMRIGLRGYAIPRIFEVPGPLHLEHVLTRNAELILSNKQDYWIATCQWTYDRYIKSGISKDRLFLTYYGNDINYPTYSSGKLRSEFKIGQDKYIVAMVAYMYAPKKWLGQKRGIKGHEDFIDALSILQKKYPDIVGVCIGGAWNNAVDYEASIKSYAVEKDVSIIFTGTQKNIGELYQDIDCVVHPSHSENLGGAAESLSLGVPTITTNIGGFPDIVIDRKTGLLVPPQNPQALSAAIEEFYLNPEKSKEYAKEGKNYVNTLLDVANTSKSVLDYYSAIIQHSNLNK